MPKQAKYSINVTKYVKKQTPGATDKFGRQKWENVGEPKKYVIKNTNYRQEKMNAYRKMRDAKENGDKTKAFYATYGDRYRVRHTKTLESTTEYRPDGTVIKTYYGKRVR